MISLSPHEARVLGVLIEKAQTTPSQYPLSLNAILSGSNQKNNRFPVLNLTEESVLDTVDRLRANSLVREVLFSGSRVTKYRHVARDVLEIGTSELVILAELLLRGPQTVGELRGRASRMHPLESLDVVRNILDHLAGLEPGLVRRIPPAPGSRAERWMQLLAPAAHPQDLKALAAAEAAAPPEASPPPRPAAAPEAPGRLDVLETRVAALEAMVESLMSGRDHDR